MLDFSFQRAPFDVTPDPRMVFRHARFAEALEALERGLGAGKGFLVITGEVGAGKTTLLRTFLARPHPDLETAVVLHSGLEADELLITIAEDLGLTCPPGCTRKSVLDRIQGHLLDTFAAGRRTVVFIDEAQHLDYESLELVRMLSNLETDTDKLLQVVLFGQERLREMLARPELFQLRSRIAVHRHLRPLEEADTASYVLHRLAAARPATPVTFSPAALRKLHLHARGLPRLVNILADGALRAAAVADSMIVDEHHVEQSVDEFRDLEPGSADAAMTSQEPYARPDATRPAAPSSPATTLPATGLLPPSRPFPSLRTAFTILSWLLLLAILALIVQRVVEDARGAAPADDPGGSALGSPVLEPSGQAPEPAADGATPAWDPDLALAFLESSGIRTEYDPPPALLADPKAFVAGLGRVLVEVHSDSSTLRAIALPALVTITSSTGEGIQALVVPVAPDSAGGPSSPGHAPSLAFLRTPRSSQESLPWDNIPLSSDLPALVALPADLGVARVGPESDAEDIRRLQAALFEAGHYADRPSGIFDEATSEAIAEFQGVQGLVATGRASAETLIALHKLGVWRP